ncbi:MAG: helix-turn-helix domain-containing protein [Verrucomicrobiae bacterium]
MKQKARHQKTARQQAAKLLLTPSLAQNAQTVVSIFDRVDWRRVGQTQCDTVHLYFQSDESLSAAHRIWLEMATGVPSQRTAIIGKIKQAFQKIGLLPGRGKISEADADQLSTKSVGKLLDNLVEIQDANHFAELCIQASLLHHQLEAEARRTPQVPVNKAARKTLLPPLAVDPPCWLGPAADLWMSVPLRLALAEPIVGLCRRVTEINTGVDKIQLKPAEEQSLHQHLRFFIECRPESYRVPAEDPFGAELQGILDAFVPAIRALIDDWSSQGNAAGLTALVKAPTVTAVTEGQPKTVERTQPGSGEKAVKIKEAAKMLGVCENTVRRLIIRNKLRRVPGLRHVLIPVSEIDRFLS